MNGPQRPCSHETLAANPGVAVQRCTDCGGIVVHAGCVSIRMDESSFEALVETLQEARRVLLVQSGRVRHIAMEVS